MPSTLIDESRPVVPARFEIAIRYAAPRNRRVAENPAQAVGRHGSIRSPSCSGRMPRIHWVIAMRFHAAEPVSQEFFASPGVAAAGPAIVWA